MENWESYLHWDFRGEQVLISSIRLESFSGFLVASFLAASVCVSERYAPFWRLTCCELSNISSSSDAYHAFLKSAGNLASSDIFTGKKSYGRRCSIGWWPCYDCRFQLLTQGSYFTKIHRPTLLGTICWLRCHFISGKFAYCTMHSPWIWRFWI